LKILSLLPSATEIVYALGLDDHLEGVTYECDYPEAARGKPVVVDTSLAAGPAATPGAIDDAVREKMDARQPLYVLDRERIRDIQPDLILAQDLCRVCAVPSGQVEDALQDLGCTSRVLSLDPFSIEEVIDGIEEVGRATGAEARAGALAASLRERVEALASTARGLDRTNTFCLEWLDPPFAGGHWIPGMVALAGGEHPLNGPRERSRVVEWEAIAASEPAAVVFMPCGFGLDEAVEQGRELVGRPEVAGARIYATDASAYLSRPGPRIVDGLEILAWCLHPEAFPEPAPGRVERLA
jgi:iron complex transport system substrate-binding protein